MSNDPSSEPTHRSEQVPMSNLPSSELTHRSEEVPMANLPSSELTHRSEEVPMANAPSSEPTHRSEEVPSFAPSHRSGFRSEEETMANDPSSEPSDRPEVNSGRDTAELSISPSTTIVQIGRCIYARFSHASRRFIEWLFKSAQKVPDFGMIIEPYEMASVRNLNELVVDRAVDVFFLELLASEEFFCFYCHHADLIPFGGIENWDLRLAPTISALNACSVVFQPICANGHWVLVVLDKLTEKLIVYDSLGAESGYCRDKINYFEVWANEVKKKHPELTNWPDAWTTIHSDHSPLQAPYSMDCGIHTMLNAFFYCRGYTHAPYTMNEIPQFREILTECLEKRDIAPLYECLRETLEN